MTRALPDFSFENVRGIGRTWRRRLLYAPSEAFVAGADGRATCKQVGPVTEHALEETILPLVARSRRQAKEAAP